MSDVRGLSLGVLHTVAEFLHQLSAHQLADLSEGRTRLTIIANDSAPGPHPPVAPPRRVRRVEPTMDMSSTKDALEHLTTRAEAAALLAPLTLKPQLKELANILGLRGVSSARRAELIESIIEFTVGNRLNSGAIRRL